MYFYISHCGEYNLEREQRSTVCKCIHFFGVLKADLTEANLNVTLMGSWRYPWQNDCERCLQSHLYRTWRPVRFPASPASEVSVGSETGCSSEV